MADSPISGHGLTIRQLFTGRRFQLGYYQREYTWSRKAVAALLDDLWRRFAASWNDLDDREQTDHYAPYFLGPFVYHEQDGITYLVDGQQRITTLHLLLIYLRRLLLDQERDALAEQLGQLIRSVRHGKPTFSMDIPEREPLLKALFDGTDYQLPDSPPSVSVRNLWERSQDLADDFPTLLRDDALPYFHDWLLDRVCLVGIKALGQDSGWEIFETMNDRGDRLRPIDLLKSFLFQESKKDQPRLNIKWRDMLSKLTAVEKDAPSEFVKALLIAQHADLSESSDDQQRISQAFHEWVRTHQDQLGLRRPSDFAEFIEWLTALAPRFATLLAASRTLDRSFEAVFYNSRNGLYCQTRLILAGLRPDDDNATFKEKARLLATFLDLLYVRRLVNNEGTNSSDMEAEVDRLIPKVRKCTSTKDISMLLGAEIATLPYDFQGVATFGLRSDNRRQVRYLLARMTHYVERECGRAELIADYLDQMRPYEIEHIWANHFDRFQTEVKTYQTFVTWRNRLGALLLLPKSDNASYRDDLYQQKIEYYRGQNLLAASLHDLTYRKNPGFTKFIKRVDLTGAFRAFRDHFNKDSIEHRQRLYRALCEKIWEPSGLGFDVPQVTSPDQATRRRTRAHYKVDVADLIRVKLLKPGTTLTGSRRGSQYAATVEPDGRIRVSTGEVFPSLSGAGQFVLDVTSCAGWDFWKVPASSGEVPIKTLRDEGLTRGLLP
ncbi:GmrSD restriction endonuclease domain-containing protein [Nonomuraea jabiensis]|uniref:GmrSD restriction endonuclease domain-containing protein n=1 Tax=Nonomuraea jabiensis TaxID=882448 RepID=UPI003D71E84C